MRAQPACQPVMCQVQSAGIVGASRWMGGVGVARAVDARRARVVSVESMLAIETRCIGM